MVESNTKVLNTELVAMKEGISELKETFNTIRRNITDQIFALLKDLRVISLWSSTSCSSNCTLLLISLISVESDITVSLTLTSTVVLIIYYMRALIDCGDLDEGQSSGIYKIFPGDSLDGFYVYCDMETDNGGWTVSQL
jgi:hypothetical protein